jgi:hypothetical protein
MCQFYSLEEAFGKTARSGYKMKPGDLARTKWLCGFFDPSHMEIYEKAAVVCHYQSQTLCIFLQNLSLKNGSVFPIVLIEGKILMTYSENIVEYNV